MIKIINYTQNPLTFIGQCVGNCYGSDTTDTIKNYKRGKECVESGHGRVLEYADIIVEISGYSARVIRELGRHVIGTTYTQESTRYINYKNFDYYIPDKIKNNPKALDVYNNFMSIVSDTYKQLIELGIPKEDVGNILSLGMNTKIVLKINARALEHLFAVRECTRAYKEFRDLMKEFRLEINKLDEEWKWLADNIFKVQCAKNGYCSEKFSCGRYPKKQ